MKKSLLLNICMTMTLLSPMTVMAAVGDVCYAKQSNRLLWQQMKHPGVVGQRCWIYNGNFVPVYEGVVGTCIKGATCGAKPLNVDIGRTK